MSITGDFRPQEELKSEQESTQAKQLQLATAAGELAALRSQVDELNVGKRELREKMEQLRGEHEAQVVEARELHALDVADKVGGCHNTVCAYAW